ncbi:MAG TPA: tryptophan synthase subunit alpha [Gemmatimonadota bacterium]|nr:tryptophan synthase subunit alpha [Gemmatimonadota bacterium]
MSPFEMERRLRAARDTGKKLLVPYLTAGFPDAAACDAALAALGPAGADAIELGVPFSDPLADGPVIAAASRRAIEGGTTAARALEAARRTPAGGPPLVLFTYANPWLALGPGAPGAAFAAGFGGVVVADLPFDEDPAMERSLSAAGLPLVRLAAPTTPEPRLRRLARGAAGFLYLIARTGVTGAGAGTDQRVADQVRVLREETDLPIVVGFGIANGDDARRAAAAADGVVVGTALVERLGRDGPAAAVEWVAGLRAALDRG